MFICENCFKKIKQDLKKEKKEFKGNISFLKSYVRCEKCGEIEECNELI